MRYALIMFDFHRGEFLLIDKPYKWTSHDVVNKIRKTIIYFKHTVLPREDDQQPAETLRSKIQTKSGAIAFHTNSPVDGVGRLKVGHAGTLDPLATGLLIVCTGKMTKKLSDFQKLDKTYTGKLILGKTTPSYDLETEFDNHFDIAHISEKLINQNTFKFTGSIMQRPPAYSALKLKGERSYKKVRRGDVFEIKPRKVFIKEFVITNIEMPEVEFKVICSTGTYIRSLVRDFGEALNAGACLSSLRRTKIGTYMVEDAYQIEDFVKNIATKTRRH